MIAQMADIVNCDNTMHILYMYLLDGFDTKQWHLVGAGAGAGAPSPSLRTHNTTYEIGQAINNSNKRASNSDSNWK